jgi:hypothetical protein
MAKYNDNFPVSGLNVDMGVASEVLGETQRRTTFRKKDELYKKVSESMFWTMEAQNTFKKRTGAHNSEPLLCQPQCAKERISQGTLSDEHGPKSGLSRDSDGKKCLEITEKRMENARWLVENKIPLSAGNLLKMEDLQNVSSIFKRRTCPGGSKKFGSRYNCKRDFFCRGESYISRALSTLLF